MKKVLLMTGALLITRATFAQTTSPATGPDQQAITKKAQMKELCEKIRAYNDTRADAKHAYVKGDFAAAKTGFAAAKVTKQEIKENTKVLKSEGVAHPTRLAHKEIKKEIGKDIRADIKAVQADKIAERAAKKAGNITAAIAEKAVITKDKNILRKDLKESKRNSRMHIAIIRAGHLFW